MFLALLDERFDLLARLVEIVPSLVRCLDALRYALDPLCCLRITVHEVTETAVDTLDGLDVLLLRLRVLAVREVQLMRLQVAHEILHLIDRLHVLELLVIHLAHAVVRLVEHTVPRIADGEQRDRRDNRKNEDLE
ncbi:hypothetical protein SAMN05216582_10493 [Selenomonas ruminantium]|uniref:Uncharacterized protein n=1 Tax=Selenomonas ruminantium TaxID=971 RepID=A0A1M6SIC3_SELRU|nr:hypothetical protein [Selenomonas ruminantium]SHK44522.1 hypothetical protein SAMN05216582_10493 [Selenomonas ruminantium]